jgi:hypothetical protein
MQPYLSLRRANTVEQLIQPQLLDVASPFMHSWQRDPSPSILHPFKYGSHLAFTVLLVCGADDESGKIEHYEGVLGVEEVLNIVLPGVSGTGAVEGWNAYQWMR